MVVTRSQKRRIGKVRKLRYWTVRRFHLADKLRELKNQFREQKKKFKKSEQQLNKSLKKYEQIQDYLLREDMSKSKPYRGPYLLARRWRGDHYKGDYAPIKEGKEASFARENKIYRG